jgi:hypothetical protein
MELPAALKCAAGAHGTASLLAVSGEGGADGSAIHEAIKWVRETPRIRTAYDYVMTARVRLLFFWVGRDDVGGGYIKVGEAVDDPHLQAIQLLFGSDPAKAPRAINRWGAATEVVKRGNFMEGSVESSAFLGFMKSSKGDSPLAMQRELSAESKRGKHLFEAIITRVDPGRAISTTVPFYSDQDFTLNQLPVAESLALQRLAEGEARKLRELQGPSQLGCNRATGFLFTVRELLERAEAGSPVPVSLCYVFNAHEYTATLMSVRCVAEKKVHVVRRGGAPTLDRTYRNLRNAHFQIRRLDTGSEDDFEVLMGAEGSVRGVPLQISYQPNWWFQVVLNLENTAPAPISESGVKN